MTALSDPAEVGPIVEQLQKSFEAGKTRSLKWRRAQLQALRSLLLEGQPAICSSMKQDLGKSEVESKFMEIDFVLNEIQLHLDCLQEWAAPKTVPTDIMNIPGKSQVISEPLGVVCILGAWNYPVQLTLLPLVGAISAGNCALVKVPPAGYSCATSRTLTKLAARYLDRSCIRFVNGERALTAAILNQRFDLFFFTGGKFVGKMVAQAAAKHLTPTILELGGKSPCVVDRSADVYVAAKRTIWAAFANAGQTCVRPDYVLVHEVVAKKFIQAAIRCIKEFYTEDPAASEYFGRIINKRAMERVIEILHKDRRYITFGGDYAMDDRYVSPTLIDFGTDYSAFDGSLSMQDEIFAPILPIFHYQDLSQAINHINRKEKPLALYCFTTDAKTRREVLGKTSSGAVNINDAVMHMTNHHLPFGGVGASGMGSYHGKRTFDAFSHEKAVLLKSCWFDVPARYPPYTGWKIAVMNLLLTPVPRWQVRFMRLLGLLLLVLFIRSRLPSRKKAKYMLMNLAAQYLM